MSLYHYNYALYNSGVVHLSFIGSR